MLKDRRSRSAEIIPAATSSRRTDEGVFWSSIVLIKNGFLISKIRNSTSPIKYGHGDMVLKNTRGMRVMSWPINSSTVIELRSYGVETYFLIQKWEIRVRKSRKVMTKEIINNGFWLGGRK